jgi:hypothetical protein
MRIDIFLIQVKNEKQNSHLPPPPPSIFLVQMNLFTSADRLSVYLRLLIKEKMNQHFNNKKDGQN